MKIGILSDTHDKTERTARAVEFLREAGAEALIHCGDFCCPEIVEICAQLPFWFVFGNNDCDMTVALERAANQFGATCLGWGGICEFDGRKLGVVHGHLTSDLKDVIALKPDVIFRGHSHIAGETTRDGMRYINPGALHRAKKYTVAIFETTTADATWHVID